MRESIVWIVQDPCGKDITPARSYGELRVMLTGKESTFQAIHKLEAFLKDIQPQDYLLQIGLPINVGLATHFALLFTGGSINLLVWDRVRYTYNVEPIKTDE